MQPFRVLARLALTALASAACAGGTSRAEVPVERVSCQPDSNAPATREQALPATLAEARAGETQRQERVVRAWTASFHDDFDDLGDWKRDVGRRSLRKIMAGLKALEILPETDPLRPPPDFPARVEQWLERESVAHQRAGTNTNKLPGGTKGDYDFVMIQILELIYHFKDSPELLSNDAIWALLHNERYQVRLGRGVRTKTRIPEVGNEPHRMTLNVVVRLPETENHILMTNAWAYLVNQWLERNYRSDPRTQRYFGDNPQRYRNEGSPLERVMLGILARPLHNGFWETNSRPYNAYSLRALQLLYSYADATRPGGRRIKLAAQNALDYAATKFAFQSFQGKRLPPFRRNHKNRDHLGIYQNDYVPYMFGVLTGAHVYDDTPTCCGRHCAYRFAQARGFALESVLSDYRVPEPIWDFMLHPDNHRPGHGVWARMQARYTERHYLRGEWPRYPGRSPDLNRAIRDGTTPLEPAPELYFITQGFMNSAGGRSEHYAAFDAWLFGKYRDIHDVFSLPSTLLYSGDIGHWRDLGGLEATTLALAGDHERPYLSNNTGVYKNFVYGYSTAPRQWPVALPRGWSVSDERQLGGATLRLIDLSTQNQRHNPRLGLYVVLGRLPDGAARGVSRGFWEVFPESAFSDARRAWECVLERNRSAAFAPDKPADYTLCLSGEKLRLNPTFRHDENPFLAIDDSRERLARDHIDTLDPRAVRALPLLEAREVDARFRTTGVVYALAEGDGRLAVDNPYLGQRLVIDSSDPERPTRQLVTRARPRQPDRGSVPGPNGASP